MDTESKARVTDSRFDNPRAVQIRLPGFGPPHWSQFVRACVIFLLNRSQTWLGLDRSPMIAILLISPTGSRAVQGAGRRRPRIYLRKLVAEVLDRVDRCAECDPRRHYAPTLDAHEMIAAERAAARAESVDDSEVGTRARSTNYTAHCAITLSTRWAGGVDGVLQRTALLVSQGRGATDRTWPTRQRPHVARTRSLVRPALRRRMKARKARARKASSPMPPRRRASEQSATSGAAEHRRARRACLGLLGASGRKPEGLHQYGSTSPDTKPRPRRRRTTAKAVPGLI